MLYLNFCLLSHTISYSWNASTTSWPKRDKQVGRWNLMSCLEHFRVLTGLKVVDDLLVSSAIASTFGESQIAVKYGHELVFSHLGFHWPNDERILILITGKTMLCSLITVGYDCKPIVTTTNKTFPLQEVTPNCNLIYQNELPKSCFDIDLLKQLLEGKF